MAPISLGVLILNDAQHCSYRLELRDSEHRLLWPERGESFTAHNLRHEGHGGGQPGFAGYVVQGGVGLVAGQLGARARRHRQPPP